MRRCAGILFAVAALAMAAVTGCKRDDMADQPRYKPLAASSFFANEASSRVPPEHTVPISAPLEAETTSWVNPNRATQFPFEMTKAQLRRGQERFTIYCAPCHGILGDGDGMIPERGMTRPPSFHTDRLRTAPPSYAYNVITNGIGTMFSYGDRVEPDDRWRIAAYIKVLQVSQFAPAEAAGTRGGGP